MMFLTNSVIVHLYDVNGIFGFHGVGFRLSGVIKINSRKYWLSNVHFSGEKHHAAKSSAALGRFPHYFEFMSTSLGSAIQLAMCHLVCMRLKSGPSCLGTFLNML